MELLGNTCWFLSTYFQFFDGSKVSGDFNNLRVVAYEWLCWRAILAGTDLRMLADVTLTSLNTMTRCSFWMHEASASELRALPAVRRPGLFAD